MRDKIARYLEEAGRPVPAERILREVLNILSPNSFAAAKVLTGILGGDRRFQRTAGLWYVTGVPAPGLPAAAVLVLEWDRRLPQRYRGALMIPKTGWCRQFQRSGAESSPDVQTLSEARRQAENHLLISWTRKEPMIWNRLLGAAGLPEWEGAILSISGLAACVLPSNHSLAAVEDLASPLDIPPPDLDRPSAVARFLAESFLHLLDRVPAPHRKSMAELETWIRQGRPRVDFSRFAFGRDFLDSLPETPGVYLMRNRAGEIIYIGKSHNLRRRVRSYFTARALRDSKTVRIHSQLYSLEFIPCSTEIEALLLEVSLIRDFGPPVNLQSEIHEQPGRYGRNLNLLLLIPSGNRVVMYLVKEGVFVGTHSSPFDREPAKKLRDTLQRTYFKPGRREAKNKDPWEVEIVARFFRNRKKHLNLIDIDEAGSWEVLLRQLRAYLHDPDRLARKVYYR